VIAGAPARNILQTADLETAERLESREEAWLVDGDPRWPMPFVIACDHASRRCGIFLPTRDNKKLMLFAQPDRRGIGHANALAAGPVLRRAFPIVKNVNPEEITTRDPRRWNNNQAQREACADVLALAENAARPPVDSFVDDEIAYVMSHDKTQFDMFKNRATLRSAILACDWLSRTGIVLRHARGRESNITASTEDVRRNICALTAREMSREQIEQILDYYEFRINDATVTIDSGAFRRLTWMAKFVTEKD
jgi:hypothetical protein